MRLSAKKSFIYAALATLQTLGSLGSLSPVFAEETQPTNSEFLAGVAAYQKKNYKVAIEHLRNAIPVMERETAACAARLYLGHCYLAIGETETAKKNYEQLVNLCYGSEEWKIAKQALESIKNAPKPGTAQGGPATAASTPGKPPAAGQRTPGAAQDLGLMGRITIVPPRMGHPAVSKDAITAVQNAILKLPKNIRKILDDGGAKLWIAPNISDRWEDSVKEGSPVGQEKGRTYGREMYVFERMCERAGDPSELTAPWSPSEIREHFLTQVGLAVNDITGITQDKDLIAIYKADCTKVPANLRDSYWVFLQDGNGINETCAELISIFLAQKKATEFDGIYADSKKWVKAKLGL